MSKLNPKFIILCVLQVLSLSACKDASINVTYGECEGQTICAEIPITYTDPETNQIITEYDRVCQPNPLSKGCRSSGGNCESCDPNAKIVARSLSLQNNETCPVTTTHTHTYETPGCWCNITFVGRRCCYCLRNL
jgi:hypothetical protein